MLHPVLPRLQNLRRLLDRHSPNGARIGIAFDEWNVWSAWNRTPGAAEALFAASMLNMLCREARPLGIDMACCFQPINEGAILVDAFSSRLTPVGQVFSLAQRSTRNNRLVRIVDSACRAAVDACAYVRSDGGIYVTLANRSIMTRQIKTCLVAEAFLRARRQSAQSALVAHELRPDSPFDEQTRQLPRSP